MAASLAGAIKALLESQSLGLPVFRDRAPDNQPLPYVVVFEAISIVASDAFNAYDDPEGHVTELAQVSLYQQWRDPGTRALTEDYGLADSMTQALRLNRLTTAPFHVAGMRVTEGPVRVLDESDNSVNHAVTVEVHRMLHRIGAVLPGDPTPLPPAPADTYGGY